MSVTYYKICGYTLSLYIHNIHERKLNSITSNSTSPTYLTASIVQCLFNYFFLSLFVLLESKSFMMRIICSISLHGYWWSMKPSWHIIFEHWCAPPAVLSRERKEFTRIVCMLALWRSRLNEHRYDKRWKKILNPLFY